MVKSTEMLQEDVVKITGLAGDGKRYVDLIGMVATNSNGDLKLWPMSFDGKIWFEAKNIESLELVER